MGSVENKSNVCASQKSQLDELRARVESLTSRDDLTSSQESLSAFLESYRSETRTIEEKSKTSVAQLESKLEQARDLKSKIDQNIQNKTDMAKKYKYKNALFPFLAKIIDLNK